MTASAPAPVPAASGVEPSAGPHHNRFHLAAVAFLRDKQLQAGSRPRVPWSGQKSVKLALAEVLANTVSWTIEPEKADA
jgi:DNA-directed RNA polymerase subunit K/omega